MRRVHGEATECVVFIGRQRNAWEPIGWVGTECVVEFIGRAWTEQAMETRPGVPHNEGNRPPTVETGVLLIGRGVAYRKTGLHGILFISTVDLLQPPTAIVHPRAPIHPASTARYSTGYCSSSPPRGPLHPALHGVLFIQRQCHRSLFIQPPSPCNAHCSSNRSASVSSINDGIAPSGSVNSHRSIARVQ